MLCPQLGGNMVSSSKKRKNGFTHPRFVPLYGTWLVMHVIWLFSNISLKKKKKLKKTRVKEKKREENSTTQTESSTRPLPAREPRKGSDLSLFLFHASMSSLHCLR